jgi:hypothetical protein
MTIWLVVCNLAWPLAFLLAGLAARSQRWKVIFYCGAVSGAVAFAFLLAMAAMPV